MISFSFGIPLRHLHILRALVAASLLATLLGLATPVPSVRAADFTVDDTGDGGDAAPANGTCATAGGVCTLRAAIEETEALGGTNTINFSVNGTITLGSALPTISLNTTITGPGSDSLAHQLQVKEKRALSRA